MYEYNFHGMFSFETNIAHFDWMFHAFESQQDAEFKMRFVLDQKLRISTRGKERVDLMLYNNAADNSIEFDYPWLRPICAKLIFEDRDGFSFYFNKNYLRFSNLVGGGWDLIRVFRSLLQVNLIKRGMYMFHAAAVKLGEDGIIIPSFSNTGKTWTAWMLAKRGAQYLSDESPILNSDGSCLGFPCSSHLSPRLINELGRRLTKRQTLSLIFNGIKAKLLSHKFAQSGIRVFPSDIFEVCERGQITKVVFIQHGVDSVREIGEKEALSRIKAIQDYEFSWKSNPFVLVSGFFNQLDINSVSSKEDAFLRTLLSRIGDSYVVSSASGEHYKVIEKLVQNGSKEAPEAFVKT